jgi:hypothetical protein
MSAMPCLSAAARPRIAQPPQIWDSIALMQAALNLGSLPWYRFRDYTNRGACLGQSSTIALMSYLDARLMLSFKRHCLRLVVPAPLKRAM